MKNSKIEEEENPNIHEEKKAEEIRERIWKEVTREYYIDEEDFKDLLYVSRHGQTPILCVSSSSDGIIKVSDSSEENEAFTDILLRAIRRVMKKPVGFNTDFGGYYYYVEIGR